jgi:Flp pilus assembly protein TadD
MLEDSLINTNSPFIPLFNILSFQTGSILEALLNSRNKEAQELVRQGLRLYVNAEYGDAEELFQKAFQYDPTDLKIAELQ